jgi:hypothetical protein
LPLHNGKILFLQFVFNFLLQNHKGGELRPAVSLAIFKDILGIQKKASN